MEHCPVRTDKLPHSSAWGGLRIGRPLSEAYAEAFVRFKCRAKSVASLFNTSVTTVRQMYIRIHGESSPSGHSPTSSAWYLDSAGRRLQSTFYLWLFRTAIATGASIPEAFISAVDISRHMFGDESKVSPDRASICLAPWRQSSSSLCVLAALAVPPTSPPPGTWHTPHCAPVAAVRSRRQMSDELAVRARARKSLDRRPDGL